MGEYANCNAKNVLKEVERKIKYAEEMKDYYYKGYKTKYLIRDVYKELSIFDWWNNYLSLSQLKDMRAFLKTAIKLGFNGYVCFKVGATGCANGMWAHVEESTNGYSPDCDCLYRSFTPAYIRWDAEVNNEWLGQRGEDLTLAQVKERLKKKKAIV